MDFPNNRHAQHLGYFRDYTVYAYGADSKGSWWPVINSLPYKASGIALQPYYIGSATESVWLLDVGIGAPGEEVIVAQDIPFIGSDDRWECNEFMLLPIGFASGSRIAVRGQTSALITGSPTGMALTIGFAPLYGGEPKYTRAETIGVDYSNTRGQNYTTSATSLTAASWYTVAASGFTRGVKAIRPHVSVATATAQWGVFQIGVGDGPTVVYTSPLRAQFDELSGSTARIGSPHMSHPIPIAIPAGQKISVRGYSATSQTLYMTVTGFS